MNDMNAIPEARPAAPPRAWRGGGRVVPTVALILAAGLAACDGDNLFDGSADDYTPVASVNAPDEIVAGQSVPVRVDAYAARGVSQISVSFSGIVAYDTVIDVQPPKPSVSEVVGVQIPSALAGTTLRVQAQAIDQLGAFSAPAEKMIAAYGPPFVQIMSAPLSVQQGQEISIDVAAVATENVDQIGVTLSGAVDKDTTVAILPASEQVRQVFKLRIPDAVQDTLLTITASARDQLGNRGSQSTVVPFVVQPPTVELVTPATVAAGGMLNLEVQARALRKVTRLTVEMWGGGVSFPTQNIPISPAQANVSQFVSIQMPGNITDPVVYVRAKAEDRSGAVSASDVDVITVPLDAPLVLGIDAPASVTAGHFLDLRVHASGARPIKELNVHWRGFRADLLDELKITPDTVVKLLNPRPDVSEDVKVKSPCIPVDGAFVVNVTARDEADELSPIATAVVVVSANSECVPPSDDDDTTSAGSVQISAAPGLRGAAPAADLAGTHAPAFPVREFRLRTAGRSRARRRMG